HAWQTALRLSRVDPAVPFSQAGGHSLAAIRLISEIRDQWGMRIELPEFVQQDPTLTELRTLIGARKPCTRVEIPRRADSTRAVLGIEQLRMWRYRRRLPDFSAYNVFGVLVMEDAPELEALKSACADLIARHES